MLEESTDTTSFASILLGVKRLRDESENNNITDRLNRGKSDGSLVEQGSSSTAIQKPFTDGETIVPKISSAPTVTTHRPQGLPVSTTYKKPTINRTLINNNARRTIFSNIQISISQKGNPLIQALKIPYEYNEKLRNCDYLINSTTFLLFLSLKYHKLHPEYIYNRIKKLNGPNAAINYNLKVLLCLVDVENNDDIVKELNKICLLNDLSLVLAWSFDECANYLNYLKQLESSNTHTSIKGVTNEDDYYQTLTNTLTSIKQINKTDTVNLITKYGSFKNLVTLSNEDDLTEIQGMGKIKINKFLSNLDQNFIINKHYPEKQKKLEQKKKEEAEQEDNNDDDFDDFEAFLKEVS